MPEMNRGLTKVDDQGEDDNNQVECMVIIIYKRFNFNKTAF